MAFGAPFPGGGVVTGTYQSGGGVLNGNTVSGLSFGAASASRYLVAVVYTIVSAPSSCTFNPTGFSSVAATKVATNSNGSATLQIWIALVPNGTGGSVVYGHGGNDQLTTAIYQTSGGSAPFSPAVTNSTANPWSSTPSIPGGAFVIGGAGNDNSGAVSWSGIAADATQSLSFNRLGTASGAFAAASSPTITANQGSSISSVAALAVWSP